MSQTDELLIVKLLKKQIEHKEQTLSETNEYNNSSILTNIEIIESIKEDIYNLAKTDFSKVKKMIQELDMEDDAERQNIESYLTIIRGLLTMNLESHTTFELETEQLAVVELFLQKVDEYCQNAELQQKVINTENSGLIEETTQYQNLLALIQDDNNNKFINDVDLLVKLFSDLEISESDKRKVLLEITKYNQNIYQKKIKNKNIELDKPRLNPQELEDVFKEFGYDLELLNEKQRERLLTYGSIKRIKEVFETLEEFNFPRFEKYDGKKMVALLVKSNKKLIEEIVNFSKERGIDQRDLINLPSALLEQSHEKKSKPQKTDPPGPHGENDGVEKGCSEDFQKNCIFFEQQGISPKVIFEKCKQILVTNNERIKANFQLFTDYGFSFGTAHKDDQVHQALTCLLSTDFAKSADLFIESGPLGYEYIMNNLSGLNIYKTKDDIAFYNIYYTYHNDLLSDEGPFTYNRGIPELRSEITRRNARYRDVDFHGITEKTKKEITGIIEPEFPNKEFFNNVIEEEEDLSYISQTVLENPQIERLEEYIDEDCPIRYKIGEKYISKLKVLRIMTALEKNGVDRLENSLLYAVTYNSLINQEEFNTIGENVKGRGEK